MKVNEVAKLTGITVRTLHYYDEIGLLKPSEITETGYRIYNESDIDVLKQILFFRELDFPLSEIKGILKSEEYDKKTALKNHKVLLMKKRERIDKLLKLLEKTIKGEDSMNFEAFDMSEIQAMKEKYAKEVREKYGDTKAYKESVEKTKDYDSNKWANINEAFSEIFKEFNKKLNVDVKSKEVQELVVKLQAFITNNFYNCTDEILSGLGVMYSEDERFKSNIDKNGEGTAEFISKAIEAYCKK